VECRHKTAWRNVNNNKRANDEGDEGDQRARERYQERYQERESATSRAIESDIKRGREVRRRGNLPFN
jgi:hypothetical protein